MDETERRPGHDGRHADIGSLPQHLEQEATEEELLGEWGDDAGHHHEPAEDRQRASCDLRSTTMSWSLALPKISATISVTAQNPM